MKRTFRQSRLIRTAVLAAFVVSRSEPSLADVSAPECDAATRAALLAPVDGTSDTLLLACSLTLDRSDYKITKRLIIEGEAASHMTLDCAGSEIAPLDDNDVLIIRSSAAGHGTWSRPRDVTIRNCVINGGVRVYGLGLTGQSPGVKTSSLSAGHTERAQLNAPTGIRLENLHLKANGDIPLYVGPGVTGLTLTGSEISGTSTSVAIYLDAESAANRIEGSYIHPVTSKRELIAVDGSANNAIADNHFSALQHGGIYLYRNCGEGGSVRHQTPHGNRITNNVFYYHDYRGSDPAVWLASRNGNRSYCDEDRGYSFGSSVSDLDYAEDNLIEANQIYALPANDMIRVDARPNTIRANVTVKPRPIGCGRKDSTAETLDLLGWL